jgi:hypothetical protein
MADVLPANSKQWKTNKVSSKTLTAYVNGELLYNDGTNTIPATTTTERLVGICQDTKAVTDAATTAVHYSVPREPFAPFEMTVGTGTIVKTDEGKPFDLASSTTVNASATTYKPVKLYKFLTTTKGLFTFNYDMGVDD